MAGKAGKSGRPTEEGIILNLNIRLDPKFVSAATIEFLQGVADEKNTSQRGIMLDEGLKAGLTPKEVKAKKANGKNDVLKMLGRR